MEFSSACTQIANIPAQAWDWQSASELSSDTGDAFGSNQNRNVGLNSSSACPTEDKGSCRRASIVVIEDNPTDVFLVKQAVAAYGLDADLQLLEDGEEAIGLIARIEGDESAHSPDLILLDINLPRTDGFEVLERLRSSDKCRNAPVIVMTSSAAQADHDKAAELGANAYFEKRPGYQDFLKIGAVMHDLLKKK